MSAVLDKSLLQPGALPPVPVRTTGDRMDNAIREHGIGNFCEWFGHQFDGEFAAFTVQTLQERNDEATQAAYFLAFCLGVAFALVVGAIA